MAGCLRLGAGRRSDAADSWSLQVLWRKWCHRFTLGNATKIDPTGTSTPIAPETPAIDPENENAPAADDPATDIGAGTLKTQAPARLDRSSPSPANPPRAARCARLPRRRLQHLAQPERRQPLQVRREASGGIAASAWASATCWGWISRAWSCGSGKPHRRMEGPRRVLPPSLTRPNPSGRALTGF